MEILRFDNVRLSTLSVADLLSGRVVVQVFGPADDVPAVLLALPSVEQPPAA